MGLSCCTTVFLYYMFIASGWAQEVTDEVYTLDLDPENEVTLNRKRDADITLPDLDEQAATLPVDLLSSISVTSLGSVTMRSTVDVVGQAADSLLADLGTRFAALTEVDGFYQSSDVFPILYPFIMQLLNPTPRVIVQVQQLLVVQRLECCKSGEETCCGIIAEMMTNALQDQYEAMKARLDGNEDHDSHRVNWRQLDSLLNMPPIALDEVPMPTEQKRLTMPLTHKFVEDDGDSIKISKRNKDGRLTRKTIYPQIPNHMLEEDNRRNVEDSSLEDGDAAHVFSLDEVMAEKVEGKETKAEKSKEDSQRSTAKDEEVDSADTDSLHLTETEPGSWAVLTPKRKLLSINDQEDDDEREEEEQDRSFSESWSVKVPKRRLMEAEGKQKKKPCKYKKQMLEDKQLVKNENCFNCSCLDGRILCYSKFVCDTSEELSVDLEDTMQSVNKLMSLGMVAKADIKTYLQYRSEFLLHIKKAKTEEDSTLHAMEMIYNGGNGPGGIPGPQMLPSLIKRLDGLHKERETQMKIFIGLLKSIESIKKPVHEEL